jgi:multidrug efflux pump subunit AcrA (membrane-fusion protein)
MKLQSNKKIVSAIIIIAVLFFAGYRLFRHKPYVSVVAVKREIVQRIIHGPGTVQSKISVSAGAKITGIIQELNTDQGAVVKNGDMLAVLDIAELKARLESARAATARAQQDVEKVLAGIASAHAGLVLAQSNYKRDLEVFNAGYISPAYFDLTRAQMKVAESEYAEALKTVEAAQAVLVQATAEAKATEATLDYAYIRAPMDGLITARTAEIGDTVTPGVPIFTIVDLKHIWVAAWIDQAQIAHLKEDQPATIRLRSGRAFEGKVARINKEADTVTRELEVDVMFALLPEPLVIGEEAEVFISAGAENCPAVPVTAMLSFDGKTGVLVVEKDKIVFREVSLGVQDEKMVSVIKGVSEGELVILEPKLFKPGQKVKPAIQKV